MSLKGSRAIGPGKAARFLVYDLDAHKQALVPSAAPGPWVPYACCLASALPSPLCIAIQMSTLLDLSQTHTGPAASSWG